MQRHTTYTVMLQIPVSYLKPSERVCREEREGFFVQRFIVLGDNEFM